MFNTSCTLLRLAQMPEISTRSAALFSSLVEKAAIQLPVSIGIKLRGTFDISSGSLLRFESLPRVVEMDCGRLRRATLFAPAGTEDRVLLRRCSGLECHSVVACRRPGTLVFSFSTASRTSSNSESSQTQQARILFPLGPCRILPASRGTARCTTRSP